MSELDDIHYQHPPAGGNEREGGTIDALLSVAPSLLKSYQRLLKTNQEIFRTELKIVLKSTLAIVLCCLVFLTIVLSLWIALNALIAAAVWNYMPSVLAITGTLVLFNIISILINLKLISFYAKQFNFKYTLSMLGIDTDF